MAGSGGPDVQIVMKTSSRFEFFGSCHRKNSCDWPPKSWVVLFPIGRHVAGSIRYVSICPMVFVPALRMRRYRSSPAAFL